MDVASYLYPWDVLGDPAAPGRIAGLGLDHVTVAAAYHATRAFTPYHPWHRVVAAEHSAAYYPTSEARWAGSPLRPLTAGWVPGPDAFGGTVEALAAAGVPAHAWVVLLHSDLPPGDPAVEGFRVVNAYGDRYPWALCAAQPAVRDYARTLAAEVAERPGLTGIELEACGWYGFDHLSAHDKTAGVSLGPAQQYLLSLCFCPACDRHYRDHGIDPTELAARIREALDTSAFQPAADPHPAVADAGPGQRETVSTSKDSKPELDDDDDETAWIAGLLGPDLAAAVARMRARVAESLRAEVIAAVRAAGPGLEVALHVSTRPHVSLSFTGVDPATAAGVADRLVVNCWQNVCAVGEARSAGRNSPAGGGAPATSDGSASVAAGLLAVGGMGGRSDLRTQVEQARAAGADGIRLYHAGLASPADLAVIRELTQSRAGVHDHQG